QYRFRGLRASEFRDVLAHYDEAEWPPGSGLTYSAHFAPDLWQQGWRLQDQAGHFVSAFTELARQLGGGVEVGMKYLVTAVRRLLLMLRDEPERANRISDAVSACVQKSGLAESRRLVGDAERAVSHHEPAGRRPRSS
ncbi:MAG: hypothetical protein ABI699_06955, partial [Caldimonas sp.]